MPPAANLLFGSDDTAALQAGLRSDVAIGSPLHNCARPDGKVIYKTIGSVDLLEMRRKILAAMPSDYIGFNKYWASGN